MIFNCGTPTGNGSEIVNSHYKTIIQESRSYVKGSGDFVKKMNQIGNIPENPILVTADLMGLYPSIPLKNALKKREQKHVPTEELINIAEFELKNNFFYLMVLLNNKFQERSMEQSVL